MKERTPEEKAAVRHVAARIAVTVAEIAMIAIIIAAIVFFMQTSGLAETEYTEAFVICTPGDVVNVRPGPSRKGEEVGRLEAGERIWLTGKKRNGYLQCETVGISGWIHSGYVVYDEPERMNAEATIVSRGRLAARKNVGGKRTRWLKPGATVKVWYVSEEWCVTNCGYIRTEFLEMEDAP